MNPEIERFAECVKRLSIENEQLKSLILKLEKENETLKYNFEAKREELKDLHDYMRHMQCGF